MKEVVVFTSGNELFKRFVSVLREREFFPEGNLLSFNFSCKGHHRHQYDYR